MTVYVSQLFWMYFVGSGGLFPDYAMYMSSCGELLLSSSPGFPSKCQRTGEQIPQTARLAMRISHLCPCRWYRWFAASNQERGEGERKAHRDVTQDKEAAGLALCCWLRTLSLRQRCDLRAHRSTQDRQTPRCESPHGYLPRETQPSSLHLVVAKAAAVCYLHDAAG